MDDLKRMCHNADSQELFAIVATLHHQTASARNELNWGYHIIVTYLSTSRSTIGI